ncbi:DUF3843 family protein [Bacteroides sp. AM44-19]|jgi:hypothetical protein|uniref:DUF3843 family protein n=2 Tax=Bacteroides TaxID=816 RepID=A0A374MPD4_BACUN|nr:DUF3843 family protein [Bacteroides uniformis]RHD59327.1 DUF3843 family protein [Bacteroides uniformis]RJU32965.1 DUF3843 family protein [Bacteroides sp. AM44-19]
MVLQFRHFFFHGIKEKKCYSLIIPPWRKYHSTTEEKSFHHGRTIFSTRWNDLIVAYKYTNRKEEKQENSHKKHIFTLEMKHIKNTHQTHFRVMKKIYPKKWLELHPYKQTNSVDQYYVGIANEIHKRLYSSTIADAFEEEENIRYTSLCLAAWFEDVISQTGIWQAFTAECRKRYGAYLPFYPIKGDYFPDEINLEDIRFLLWHHIQYLCRGISAINPENPGIEQTAQEIYGLLAEEYETAPENERMQEFLYHSAMGEEDFFRYREILDWFHYQCYFNIENVAQCRDEAERLLDDEKITPEMAETLIYATRTSLTFKGRRNLLSLTSPEWLALIGKAHPEHQLWGKVKARENSCYLLEKEDDEFLYVKDLCSEDEGEFKITKKSLNLSAIRSREAGKSTLICELIYFGNAWWQCGMLLENKYNQKMAEYVDDLTKQKEKTNEKAAFHDFIKASGGKSFVFCQSQEEISDFLLNKMDYNLKEGLDIPRINTENGAMLMANPHTGLHIQFKLCECIKSPDNPNYNKEEAEKNAIMFIVNPDIIPYQLSCILQDEGMLPDAYLNSLQRKEYGQEFIRKNAHFLTDYFHYRCREKDFD